MEEPMSEQTISPRLYAWIVWTTLCATVLFTASAWWITDGDVKAIFTTFTLSMVLIQLVLWLCVFFLKKHPFFSK